MTNISCIFWTTTKKYLYNRQVLQWRPSMMNSGKFWHIFESDGPKILNSIVVWIIFKYYFKLIKLMYTTVKYNWNNKYEIKTNDKIQAYHNWVILRTWNLGNREDYIIKAIVCLLTIKHITKNSFNRHSKIIFLNLHFKLPLLSANLKFSMYLYLKPYASGMEKEERCMLHVFHYKQKYIAFTKHLFKWKCYSVF